MSGSSSSSLSRLLSQTKLSSFDPKLPQIYTSPKAYSDRGDWGFTKSIPPTSSSSSKRLQYLTLSNLESNSGHIPWKSNESRPRFLKRFKENPIRFNNGSNLNNNPITHNGLSTSSSSSSLSPGSLGPRPRSIFDKHSYRPLPIESLPTQVQNDQLSDQDKLLLQSKRNSNRSGYGYLYSNTGDLREIKGTSLDPLGENSDQYSNHSNLFPNYNLMSDKQFERFIEKIRLDEHGLMTSTSNGEEQSEKKKAGNYRKELERKEFNQRRDLLNRLKERYREQAIYQVREAKEIGATPSSDALYFSQFSSSEKIPDHEFLKRSNGALNETMAAILEDGKDGSSEGEDGNVEKKRSSSGVEIDLWNEARKINTFNSADYLRKTLSFLESCDPNSTKLPTSSLVGGGGGGNKSNSTGTRHSREGLQYSNPDKIYTSRLSEPIKGRVLNDQARDNRTFRRNGSSSNRNSNPNLIVGMNGLITELPKGSKFQP